MAPLTPGSALRSWRALLFAVAALLGATVPAAALVDEAVVEYGEVRGVPLRRVAGAPDALYLGEGVPLQHADWTLEAMRLAWPMVPALTGLPLPGLEIPVFLFRDREQFRVQAQQLVGPTRAAGGEGCFSRSAGADRGIFCHAPTLDSRERTIDYIAHELTHQLVQGDLEPWRGILTWYNEGLAEYAQNQVLRVHGPAYAAADWARHERRVADALRAGTYQRLEHLSTGGLWHDATDRGLAYAQSTLAVHWLVERHGTEKVADVVRETGPGSAFSPTFARVFGYSTTQFETELEAALRARLLGR